MNRGRSRSKARCILLLSTLFLLALTPGQYGRAQAQATAQPCQKTTFAGKGLALPQDGYSAVADSKGVYVLYTSPTQVILQFLNSSAYPSEVGLTFAQHIVFNGTGIATGRIALGPGHIYVSWLQDVSSVQDVMLATNSSGLQFSSPVVAGVSSSATGTEMAVSGPNVYLGYLASGGIGFSVSHDNGSTFTSSVFPGHQEVNLVAFRSDVYMVWESLTQGEGKVTSIWLMSSQDNGTTWALQKLPAGTEPREPIMAVSANGTLYITWRGNLGAADFYIMRSADGATTFSPYVNVSNDSTDSREPWVSSDGNSAVYVIYRDAANANGYNVYLGTSNDSGSSFKIAQLGTVDGPKSVSSDQWSPEVASSNGTFAVLWNDQPSPKTKQMYITLGNSTGFTNVLLGTAGSNIDPRVSTANGIYYAVWKSGKGVGFAMCVP